MSTTTLSPLDTDRFGIQSARAFLADTTELAEVLAFCRQNSVVFLTARCAVDSIAVVHQMEQHGFQLMDSLVYYQYDFRLHPESALPQLDAAYVIRLVRREDSADVEGVTRVAKAAFHHYQGHYHADPRLNPIQCDEVYVSWATRSCTIDSVANGVLVAEQDGRIMGFSTLKLNSPDEGECPLFAVSPELRGKGIYHALVDRAIEWHRAQHVQYLISSTQIGNFASQRTWSKHGWTPYRAFYTFHKWFN